MTNEQLVNRFKNKCIAINCQTEEQAKEFIEWVYANGMSWCGSADKETCYHAYKENTCYCGDTKGRMSFDEKAYFENEAYEVITYTDFFKEENKPVKKNFIPQVAEMLGLEIGEEIDVYYSDGVKKEGSPYHFRNNRLLDERGNTCEVTLLNVLSGQYSFKKHQPIILDEVEKCYLENVLRPFKDRVEKITKVSDIKREYLRVVVINEASMLFPYFDENTMYKGMKADKPYTLEEMGLFADER